MRNKIVTIILIHSTFTVLGQDVLVPFRANNQWGFANSHGKIIIKPKYDSVGIFGFNKDSVDVAKIKDQGNYFFINRKGEKIEFKGKELDYYALKKFDEYFITHTPEFLWRVHRNVYFCYSEGLYGIKSDSGCKPLFLNFGFVKDDEALLESSKNKKARIDLKVTAMIQYDLALIHYALNDFNKAQEWLQKIQMPEKKLQ